MKSIRCGMIFMLAYTRFRATLFARVRSQDFLAINPRAWRALDEGQAPPAALLAAARSSSPDRRRRVVVAAAPRRAGPVSLSDTAVADFETTGSPSTESPRLVFGTTEIKPSRERYPCGGLRSCLRCPRFTVCKSSTAMAENAHDNLESCGKRIRAAH